MGKWARPRTARSAKKPMAMRAIDVIIEPQANAEAEAAILAAAERQARALSSSASARDLSISLGGVGGPHSETPSSFGPWNEVRAVDLSHPRSLAPWPLGGGGGVSVALLGRMPVRVSARPGPAGVRDAELEVRDACGMWCGAGSVGVPRAPSAAPSISSVLAGV